MTKQPIIFVLIMLLPVLILISLDIRYLKTAVKEIQAVDETQAKQIKQLETRRILKPIDVTVTAYSPREQETDSTPYETAFLRQVKLGTIAVSHDLFLDGWIPGKQVYLYKCGGVYNISTRAPDVYDLTDERLKKHIDIFFFSTDQAYEFGVKKCKAILLDIE